MKGQEARSTSSCAACKFLKRKCIPNCIFAPYFRSDELRKFAKVHKVFGASNVSKILSEVPEERRADTVNSLAYEAEARLRDPVFGCIGAIALLQRRMVQLQHDLAIAKAHLAHYKTNNNNNNNLNHHLLIYSNDQSDQLYGESTSTSTASIATATCKPIESSAEAGLELRGTLFDVAVGSALMSQGTSNTSGLGLQQHGSFINVPIGSNWLPT
ncbi:hypothetical protein Sjap_014180 [Stephania japonica]|uniref:LOB domain-containing protein n=1 Tax=Stephania japonica TaxID=461633 RepID=A0AAP0J160_9MAGN